MSYLVVKSASNATPESYQLTSNIDKPRLVVSGSYIPITTNGTGNLKVANGNTTYHVMKTSTSSYSQSASASATYLTTADSPNGLSNITNLTRSSTVNALTRSSTSSVYTRSSSYRENTTQPYPSNQTMIEGRYEIMMATESNNGNYTRCEFECSSRIKSFIATRVSTKVLEGDTLSQFYPELTNAKVTLTINDTRESARASVIYLYSISPGFIFRSRAARYTYETHIYWDMSSFTDYETTTSLTRESIYSYGTCSSISGYSTQESVSGYSGVSSSSSSSSKSASSTCWR